MFGCFAATCSALPACECIKVRSDVAPDTAVAAIITEITAYHITHVIGADQLAKLDAKILVRSCVGGALAPLVTLAKLTGVKVRSIFGTCEARNLATAEAAGVIALDYRLTGSEAWERRGLAVYAATGAATGSATIQGFFRRGLRSAHIDGE